MTITAPETVQKERIPNPAGYRRQEMEPGRDAWDLIQRVWLNRPGLITLPVDPVAISRRVGIEVWSDDELPSDVPGVLRKECEFKNPEIFLNESDPLERRRFTCAHALGHYSRNLEIGRDGSWEIVESRDFFAAELRDVEEIYATEFAAEMLMPRVALRELDRTEGIAPLAARFAVTGDTMRFRLDQIGWRR